MHRLLIVSNRLPMTMTNRLIQLYTFKDEVVLDPFCGSSSASIAAIKAKRHYIGL